MSKSHLHKISATAPLEKLLYAASEYSHCAFFITSRDNFFAAVGAQRILEITDSDPSFERLRAFHTESNERIAGFLGYDLNNRFKSGHQDPLDMPDALFFEPLLWIEYKDNHLALKSRKKEEIAAFLEKYHHPSPSFFCENEEIVLRAGTSNSEYVKQFDVIQNHLKNKRIDEVNYCIEFRGVAENFNAVNQFLKLQELTRAPFSVYAKLNDKFILSASPERYLKHENGLLTSQPIKGTIKRSGDEFEDKKQIENLLQNPKERSENEMTAHLVLNELIKIALADTAQINKLCEVQSFKTVHHLVSTVSARLDTARHTPWDAIKATFPMASMTGVPKTAAMEVIRECENFKRGAYSGAFGWMDPSGNFDFNVLIRTLLYNQSQASVSVSAGGAITVGSQALSEYRECLLKAQAVLQSLKPAAHESA